MIFSSVQSLSRVRLSVTPWTATHQASLSITNSWSLLKLISIESVMPSNHLILCCPLLLTPSIFPSIMVFSNFSSSYQVAKVLEFQLEHHSFQRIFRTDFLQDGLVGSPCSPRDSQESSLIPQFKSISSLVLSFLYSPTLTSTYQLTSYGSHLTYQLYFNQCLQNISPLIITYLGLVFQLCLLEATYGKMLFFIHLFDHVYVFVGCIIHLYVM